MRIAIDATSVPTRPAGAGTYGIELVSGLTRCSARDGYALYARGDWAAGIISGLRNWRLERVTAGSRPARLAWEQLRLPGALDRLSIDVLHSTHHTLPLRPIRARRVVTIHDVTFFRIPERYPPVRRAYFQWITRLSTRVADAIIVPSVTVCEDVIRTLGIDAGRVTVVYEAAAHRFAPVGDARRDDVLRRYDLTPGYLLSVGSQEPGKNRARLVQALRALRDRGIDVRLVIVGQPAWKYHDEYALVQRLGMGDRVRYLGYVPDDDVVALYSGATAVTTASLYEGFGLPVLEAMACGVPVLTSNISATAEVAGDAALLVDPYSVRAIEDGIDRLISDARLRAQFREAGMRRAAEFSWERAAAETRAVYRRVIEAS